MPLNIDFQQVLLHLFNFVILGGGLYFLLYKPVREFMEKRAKTIRDQMDEAKKVREEAEAVMADYQQKITQVNEEIRKKQSEAEQRIAAERKEMEEEAKKAAADYLKRARQDAEKERSVMMEEAHKEIRSIAAEAAEKLVRESVSGVYDEFLENAANDRR